MNATLLHPARWQQALEKLSGRPIALDGKVGAVLHVKRGDVPGDIL